MKKFIALIAVIAMVTSCEKEAVIDSENNLNALPSRLCYSNDMLEQQLTENPDLAYTMEDIERFTSEYLANHVSTRSGSLVTIPVVVNVIYKTSTQNISASQIQSQIDVLNDDFGGTNSDASSIPSIFNGVKAGDTGIEFELVNVVRKYSRKRSWRLNDAMKKSNKGGISPTSPSNTLNIWVCNLSSGYLGYAQFPGGNAATDGVVITTSAMGTIGTAQAPFNQGRTGTHEVGHWLNLRHIWGDQNCGSDFVADTPTHNTANYGCPSAGHQSTCSGSPVEMTMNYMDYTDDACMFMFSNGQEGRMAAVFAPGGPRASFN